MTLKKQSIKNGTTILVAGKSATKEEVIALSESWTEAQESFFKKMIKQGGKFRINGVPFEIYPKDQVLRYDGTKDKGVFKSPGVDDRF